MDETEGIRREMVAEINSQVASDDESVERRRLEQEHGQVWNTEELGRDFEVEGFMAPCVVVRRRSDGQKGSMFFQHMPRFYFDFVGD